VPTGLIERPVVVFSESEMILAGSVAVQRYAQNLARGKREMFGAEDRFGFQYMMDGAMGELAVAKHLNIHWNGSVGDLMAKDVGRLQVRTTRMPEPALILHDKDPDEDVFVLVRLHANRAQIAGWVYGFEGKQKRYWSAGKGGVRPAYFVPTDGLLALEAHG
jgi:hypothetical protein